MRAAILASLTAYLATLQPGDTLIYQHLQAAFFVTGVHKVTGLTVNGSAADVLLGGGLGPQVATLGIVTLTDV